MRSQRSDHESSEHCTIGTILGSQAVEEIVRWVKNRKTESRIEEAHADSEEFNTANQGEGRRRTDLRQIQGRYRTGAGEGAVRG